MGTDIYYYTVISKDGKILKINYKSGQECGLAEDTKGFWVTALCEMDTGAYKFDNNYKYVGNCPLTSHPFWKAIPFEYYPSVVIDNVKDNVFDEFGKVIEGFGSYSSMGSSGGVFSVKYRDAASATKCMNTLNGSPDFAQEGKVLEVKPSGLDVPVNHYDLPESCFEQWISSITLDNVVKECSQDDEEDYWDTVANYTIEVTDEKWIEHLSEGMSWAGR
mmetsp:Transcript_34015/g.38651  ORF Transcript_34015/g.38651 Transcript_34015/m.38651 type:complete len:219 (-) Transcript_34015:111-767(-)